MTIGSGLPSSETVTSLALGARRRKVTRWSACTSGETSGGGGGGGDWGGLASCAEAQLAMKKRRLDAKNSSFADFIVCTSWAVMATTTSRYPQLPASSARCVENPHKPRLLPALQLRLKRRIVHHLRNRRPTRSSL